MPLVHFLNVGQGDCTVIEHLDPLRRVTVIDVSLARWPFDDEDLQARRALADVRARLGKPGDNTLGNYGQKAYPTNPIAYMAARGVRSVFRFIGSHPEMDHLDGLADLHRALPITNFWSIGDQKPDPGGWGPSCRFREEDWRLYETLRDRPATLGVAGLVNFAGSKGPFWNCNGDGDGGGDHLHVLSPTRGHVTEADRTGDYNDASYVLLLYTPAGRVLFCGDSHDATWEHILRSYGAFLRDVEVMIAPHHGRCSGRSYKFLDVVRPRVTLFGIARSDHLGYSAWSSRGLRVYTNNQCRDVILDCRGSEIDLYCTNARFARDAVGRDPMNPFVGGYFVQRVTQPIGRPRAAIVRR